MEKILQHPKRDNYHKPYHKNKYHPNYSKKYYLRKSRARKPFLQKGRHVRKFRPDQRTYKSKISCYACGDENHLSTNCPKRHNLRNKEAMLVEHVNEDLIAIDADVSDTESIYSIESIEIPLDQDL